MEELAKLVSSKTGLGHDQALAAIKVVIDFLKSKLPAPIAGELDAVLKNQSILNAAESALADGKIDGNDVSGLIGGLFGGGK